MRGFAKVLRALLTVTLLLGALYGGWRARAELAEKAERDMATSPASSFRFQSRSGER